MGFQSIILQHNQNGKHSQWHSLNRLFVSLEKTMRKNYPESHGKKSKYNKRKKTNQIKSKFLGISRIEIHVLGSAPFDSIAFFFACVHEQLNQI